MNQTQINETKSKKWCKWLPLLAAFLIPLLISVIICIDHEVYPFGERCLLQVDMYHQYCPFFTDKFEINFTSDSASLKAPCIGT